MVEIELKNVTKSFGKIKALENINLKINDKEYFVILGPTGAGKTTLLKIIAGLIKPDSGRVFFNGKEVTDLPPNKRNLGYVFENYALFPHMNVFQNISYSGRVKDRDPELIKTLTDQVLMITLLKGRNDAYPHQLSGGMQQRVALCRALLNLESTGLLLLDEPLKALDAGLRMSLRKELLDMSKSKYLQLTTVHVTNDTQEAMMIADRIVILNKGKIIQIGTPYEIFYRPKNLFVANFMSEINCFKAICLKSIPAHNIPTKKPISDKFLNLISTDTIPIALKLNANTSFIVNVPKTTYEKLNDNEQLLLVVRTNHFKIRLGDRTTDKLNSLMGIIKSRQFIGYYYRFEIEINDKNSIDIIRPRIGDYNDLKSNTLIIYIPATNETYQQFTENKQVTVYFPKELGIVFKLPSESEFEEVFTPK